MYVHGIMIDMSVITNVMKPFGLDLIDMTIYFVTRIELLYNF